MKKTELLSPAGSMESLYAAVQNGADAVYLGGQKFSARAYASNFDEENMKAAVDYCHLYGVRVYVTLNTLIKESEMDEALKYAAFLCDIGVDALIIQDVGLFYSIKSNLPDFEMHASTQMTIHNGEGALFLKEAGFKRIVLSREMSLSEIEIVSSEFDIETEIFIHGALCICYSGQCLMSSMIGGRSGNRGRCAQPCRLKYTLEGTDGNHSSGYLLSPKDVCTIEDIKSIIKTGTSSLKIEGRMKRPEYVAGVVSSYRRAIDAAAGLNPQADIRSEYKNLLQLFNREGFSKAYLYGNKGKDMMAYNYPKNTGIEIGRVQKDGSVLLKEPLEVNDGIRAGESGFTISKIVYKGEKAFIYPKAYKEGDILYKTSDANLQSKLGESFRIPYLKKIEFPLRVYFNVGEPFRLTARVRENDISYSGDVVQKAEKRPTTEGKIIEGLEKSGDTPIKFKNIEFDCFNEGFLAVSSINSARRGLIQKIEEFILKEYDRNSHNDVLSNQHINRERSMNVTPDAIACVCRKDQLDAVLESGIAPACDIFMKHSDITINDIKDRGIYLKVPNIIKGEFEEICSIISDNLDHIGGLVTANLGIIKRFKDKTRIIGDYKLNVMNSRSSEFYKNYMDSVCLSVELNKKELAEIARNTIFSLQMLIYGRIELMVSEYCPIGCVYGGKSERSGCSGACKDGDFYLRDRMNSRFLIKPDMYCRSHIYNSVPLNLIPNINEIAGMEIKKFRLDFIDEDYEETSEVLRSFKKGTWEDQFEGYTRGHYKRGVE
jgi:putative protease